jgi:hypothetical protein
MSKLTIVLRVGLITILLVTSTVLLISNYDFPTYAAGGMLDTKAESLDSKSK